MRKDAKIGFAIGGVLLAVLTVYAIVVPKHSKKPITTVSLVTPPPADSSAQPSTPPMTAAGDAGSGTPATPPAKDPAPAAPHDPVAGNITPGDPIPPATPADPPKLDEPKPGPVVLAEPPIGGNLHNKPTKPGKLEVDPGPPTLASDRVYVVQSGQTLSSIANEIYGNPRFWVAIQRENKQINANHLKIGEKINLPDITPLRPGAVDEVLVPDPALTIGRTVEVAAPSIDGHSYLVKPGDSLYKIAKTILGSGRKAEALYVLNKDVIGPDKTKLKLGMVLKLPGATTVASAREIP